MPKKSKKKHGKKGGMPAVLITVLLSISGALPDKGQSANSPTSPLFSVTVNNVNNNITVINQSSVK